MALHGVMQIHTITISPTVMAGVKTTGMATIIGMGIMVTTTGMVTVDTVMAATDMAVEMVGLPVEVQTPTMVTVVQDRI